MARQSRSTFLGSHAVTCFTFYSNRIERRSSSSGHHLSLVWRRERSVAVTIQGFSTAINAWAAVAKKLPCVLGVDVAQHGPSRNMTLATNAPTAKLPITPDPRPKHTTMAKKAIQKDQIVKLIVGAGQASPSPPVGPALGSKGVKSMDFCKVGSPRLHIYLWCILS